MIFYKYTYIRNLARTFCVVCNRHVIIFAWYTLPNPRHPVKDHKNSKPRNTISRPLFFAVLPLAILIGIGVGYLIWGRALIRQDGSYWGYTGRIREV